MVLQILGYSLLLIVGVIAFLAIIYCLGSLLEDFINWKH
jgi:hypothetical protein